MTQRGPEQSGTDIEIRFLISLSVPESSSIAPAPLRVIRGSIPTTRKERTAIRKSHPEREHHNAGNALSR